MGLECAAAALLAVALRDEKIAADVDEGDVVLGIAGPFPHI